MVNSSPFYQANSLEHPVCISLHLYMLSFFLSGTVFLNKHWNWLRTAPWSPQEMTALRDVHESLEKKIKPPDNILTGGSESLATAHVQLHLNVV